MCVSGGGGGGGGGGGFLTELTGTLDGNGERRLAVDVCGSHVRPAVEQLVDGVRAVTEGGVHQSRVTVLWKRRR